MIEANMVMIIQYNSIELTVRFDVVESSVNVDCHHYSQDIDTYVVQFAMKH